MRAALFLSFAVFTFAVAANADVPEGDKAKCEAGGGCLTMTRVQILKAMTDAHEAGRERGMGQGYVKGQQTCWKPT